MTLFWLLASAVWLIAAWRFVLIKVQIDEDWHAARREREESEKWDVAINARPERYTHNEP